MAAVAKWCLFQGKSVSGSDLCLSEITDGVKKIGAEIFSGHAADQVKDADLVIYSIAVPEDNAERIAAREKGIQELSYAQALGELSKEFSTIVVTGTHGKSTTTTMLGLILEEAGYDPTVLVGSLVPGFEHGNLRIGKGRFFVVEGCEYQANMIEMAPEMIVLTNIEEDHLDYYRNIDHVRETFQIFVDKLTGKGLTIFNKHDEQIKKLNISKGVSYGLETSADYFGANRETKSGVQAVNICRNEEIKTELGKLSLAVPGAFNVMNALAATTAAMELGVPFETCKKALESFGGIWRRFERVGTHQNTEVISDYGHHPTAIKATIEAAKEFFPNKKIVLCYQPHQHSRTEKLFDDFIKVLSQLDLPVILSEVYDVAGRNEDQSISSQDIVNKIQKPEIQFARDLDHAHELFREIAPSTDVLIVMGAGDVDSVARRLVQSK